MSDWEPPKNETEDYGVKAERAPIGRWLLSALLLLSLIHISEPTRPY